MEAGDLDGAVETWVPVPEQLLTWALLAPGLALPAPQSQDDLWLLEQHHDHLPHGERNS